LLGYKGTNLRRIMIKKNKDKGNYMKLFESHQIKSLTLKNRIVMAPMCMYMANESGFIQPFHFTHYATRAYGGVGLIITEATAVEPRGRITSNDLGIWNDEFTPGLSKLVETVHQAGAKIGIQLAHAGRKGKAKGETIIAPTAVAFGDGYALPLEMSLKDIQSVVMAFRMAARRAKTIGYDLIEIHGAHGYLINQFLSPLSNHRTDAYGGSKENRRRLLNEVIEAIRLEWDGPLCLRLSADEYAEGGNHLKDTLDLIQTLNHKIDVLNISSGGVVPITYEVYSGYQMEFAKQAKALGYTVIGGGLIGTAEDAEKYLEEGCADFIYLGRKLLRSPYFVMEAAKIAGRNDLIIKPYERGF